MTRRTRGVLALVQLVALSLALVAGAMVGPWLGVHEDPTLRGHLLVDAFRPLLAGACDTPEARHVALATALRTRSLTAWLAREAFAESALCQVLAQRAARNLIVDAGEAFMVDAFGNTTELENLNFHGIGTGTVAAAEGDTALGTELTTQYNPDNTRATGTKSEPAANQYRTVGTNTVDATVAATEWGLFSQAATGGGTLWSRVVYTVINLASGDSLQTTYTLTVE